MTGEELYNVMASAQGKILQMGGFTPYSETLPEIQTVYETAAQAISQPQTMWATTPINDESLNALGWDEQQKVYERLFQIGHRIR